MVVELKRTCECVLRRTFECESFALLLSCSEYYLSHDIVSDTSGITALEVLLISSHHSMDGQHLEKGIRREIAAFIMTGIERNSDSKTWKQLEGSLKPCMSK